MGKIRSDLHSYSHSLPRTPEGQRFHYVLKAYVETADEKDQQTIKINFFRFYEESLNRIVHQRISEEVKQNQIRRLQEIKEQADRWEKAQEIFKFFYERQLEQNEASKIALLNYLEFMAKQEMLAKAIFFLNLIKLLDAELTQIEDKIKHLENESQMIQARMVHTATQLVIDSLPTEIKNSPQADIIRDRFAKQYSATFSTDFKSMEPHTETNKSIVAIAEKVVLKDFIKDPNTASSYHDSLNKKVNNHQNLRQDSNFLQKNRGNINQLKVEHKMKSALKEDVTQQLAKLSPEIQTLARSILSEKASAPEPPKQDTLQTISSEKHDSTLSIFETFRQNGEAISLSFSSFEDEPPLPPPSSPSAPPQSTITENNPKVELVNDKNTKESTEEPQPSSGLKPRQSGG